MWQTPICEWARIAPLVCSTPAAWSSERWILKWCPTSSHGDSDNFSDNSVCSQLHRKTVLLPDHPIMPWPMHCNPQMTLPRVPNRVACVGSHPHSCADNQLARRFFGVTCNWVCASILHLLVFSIDQWQFFCQATLAENAATPFQACQWPVSIISEIDGSSLRQNLYVHSWKQLTQPTCAQEKTLMPSQKPSCRHPAKRGGTVLDQLLKLLKPHAIWEIILWVTTKVFVVVVLWHHDKKMALKLKNWQEERTKRRWPCG